MWFFDSNNGIAVGGGDIGSGMIILKTTDGGTNWNVQYETSYSAILSSVFFTDNNTGYAVGSYAILKTTDGGNTWVGMNSISDNNCAYFFDANTGFVAGKSGILKTTDGGNTWNYVALLHNREEFYSIFFANENTGYAVGKSNLSTSLVYKTTDGGNTWIEDTLNVDYILASVYFSDANHGWITGENGTILHFDGGPSGINDPVSYTGNINIYPNPSSDKINMDINKNIKEIKVMDNLGAIRYQQNVRSVKNIQLDISGYPNGMYILSFTTLDGQTFSRKIIKM